MDTDALTQLRKMVIGQKSAGLPDVPATHPLFELHQQLAGYDAFVTQTVIRVLGGDHTLTSYPQDDQMRSAFSAAEAGGEDAAMLQQLRRYQQRLDTMLSLAQQAAAA